MRTCHEVVRKHLKFWSGLSESNRHLNLCRSVNNELKPRSVRHPHGSLVGSRTKITTGLIAASGIARRTRPSWLSQLT